MLLALFLYGLCMSQSCIFVDGENLRYSLVDLFEGEFDRNDYLPRRARWQEFFNYLATECYGSERLRAYGYVVQHCDFWPWRLPLNDPPKLIRVLSKHGTFEHQIRNAADQESEARSIADDLNRLRRRMEHRFNGWESIQNGIVLAHEAVEFRRAGAIRYDLFQRRFGSEKAVDVNLAVDRLELSGIYDVAIIVSGDGDYVPAVQAVKDRGKRVVNVAFTTRDGRLLPGGARRLNQVTDRVLTVGYDQMKQYMLPDP